MPTANPSRLVRLTAIQTMLQARQRITAREIADKFGVSMRTVYRDMRALERAGVPIYTEAGRGYALVDGYTLPPVALSESEANALITAEQLIVRNRDASLVHHYQEAIIKIKAVLRHGTQEKAELLAQRVVFRNNVQAASTSDNLSTLQLAITHRHPVALVYRALTDQQTTRRTVEPLAVYSTHENWILIAWCRLRGNHRSFRLDYIEQLTVLSETFPDRHFRLADYFEHCRKKFLPPDTGLSLSATTFGFSHQPPLKMNQVTVESFTVVGISVRTTNQDGRAAQDISALWSTFLSENIVAKIPNKTDQTVYAVYTDYEGDHTQPYTVLLGCRVSDASTVPGGTVAKHVPGGTYQPFTAKGSLPQGVVYQTWVSIWNTDIDRAYTADFEVYDQRAYHPEEAEVPIYIAVKPS